MDLRRLSIGDRVVVGSGLLLLVASWLPWFRLELGNAVYTRNAWDELLTGALPVLLGVLLGAWALMDAFDVALPDPPVPASVAAVAVAAIVAVLIGWRVAVGSGADDVPLDRSYGLAVALLAALGLVAGTVLELLDERGQLGHRSTPTPF